MSNEHIIASRISPSHGLPLCNIGGFLLAFQSCLTFLFFQSTPQLGTTVRLGLTFTWFLIVFGYSIVDPPPKTAPVRRNRPLQWIFAYLALSGLSLFWTVGGSLSVSGAYWAGIVTQVITIHFLLQYPPVELNAHRLMRGFLVGVLLVALIAWSIPAMSDLRLGNEDFLHPNLIGFDFAIGTLIAIYLAHLHRAWSVVAGLLGVTMIRTLSKGAIISFLFAGLYYLVRGLKVSRRTKLCIGICCVMVLACFWGLLETYLDAYSQGSNIETLTGRTYIWSQSLELSLQKPWLGHGFDSFRWVFPSFNAFQPNHAHNELLQQLFAYGIAGVFVTAGVYWSFYLHIRSSVARPLRSLAAAILILVLVRGLVDTNQFDLGFPLWLMTMLSVVLVNHAASPASALS